MTTIINELLCYMLNKVDSIPQDTLVRLISENFNDDEVETAKSLLCSHVDDSVKAGNRRGQNKKQLNIQDIFKMILECNRGDLPRFVALNLDKLPPISIDCIDVSALLRKQQLMEMDMSQLKSTVDEVLKVSAETSRRVETVLCAGAGAGRVSLTTLNAPERPVPQERTSATASAEGPTASTRPGGHPATQRTPRSAPELGESRLPAHPEGRVPEAAAAAASRCCCCCTCAFNGGGLEHCQQG